jgi:small subunit ribosomal protein S17
MTGVVTSNKMMKTVVVEITHKYRHPLYHKVVQSRERVKAHDELNCQIGDEVQIVESRPISRDKRWVVETIVKRERFAEEKSSEAAAVEAAEAEASSETEA